MVVLSEQVSHAVLPSPSALVIEQICRSVDEQASTSMRFATTDPAVDELSA